MPALSPRTRRAALVGAVAVLALAGCGKNASDTAKSQTSVAPPVTVERTTTAPPTTTPTTTTAPALVGMPTPEDAARKLFDAWKAGDKVTAATIGTPEAVTHIWATPPADYYLYSRCDSAEFDTSGCLWRGNPGTIQFDLAKQGAVWIVSDAVFSPA